MADISPWPALERRSLGQHQHRCMVAMDALARQYMAADPLSQRRERGAPNSYELIESTLIQPCFIGDGCRISHSVVGPYVSMQKECSLSHSIISNSILDDKVQIQNRVMKDSVVGANNQLAATPEIVSLGDQED